MARRSTGPMATMAKPAEDASTPAPRPPVRRSDPAPTAPQLAPRPQEDERASIGKARERAQRRQQDSQLPRVDWTWLVIGGAVLGVIAMVVLIMIAATGGAAGVQPTPDGSATSAFAVVRQTDVPTPDIKAWDGQQRLNILVMGLDKRPGEPGSSFRTDTLILVSLDPRTKSVGMLSIPRDIEVPIPGVAEMQPVNTAYVLGELKQPQYGPRLTAETIQYNLGIRIDRYVVIQFEAVIDLIDAIGGITVDVPKTIDDKEFPDLYTYGYDPLYIPAGLTQMDGLLALKYARTRHQDSDFDRADRQQQVLMAARQKMLGDIPGLVGRAPQIWQAISKNVNTDFTFDQLLGIAWWGKDITDGSIKRGSINNQYLQAAQYQGRTVVTINRSTIAQLLTEVFGPDYNR